MNRGKSRRRGDSRPGPRFEALESRQLLALTIFSDLPVVGEYAYTTEPDLLLSGTTDDPWASEIRVNGQVAASVTPAGLWSSDGPVTLNPGINRVFVETYVDGTLSELPRETEQLDVWYDGPPVAGTLGEQFARTGQPGPREIVGGSIDRDLFLAPYGGPYHVTGDLVIRPGVTLTILPGTTVYFDPDVEVRVEGTLVARGSQYARIRLTSVPNSPYVPNRPAGARGLPDGPPRWRGIHFDGTMSPSNVIAFADIEYAEDRLGSIGATGSEVTIENVTFRGTHLRMVVARNSSMIVRDGVFPDMFGPDESPGALGLDNIAEHIVSIGQIPDGGHFIIEGNLFGRNKGHNDVIDVVSGNRPQPIVQVLDNVFLGTGDEHLDLGGDVYVAGNLFMNVAQDEDNPGRRYANAIATGDGRAGSMVVAVRNVFWNVDHAIHLRDGDSVFFENNTVVQVAEDYISPTGNPIVGSAIQFFIEDAGEKPGGRALAANNIFTELPRLFGNPDLPLDRTTSLVAFGNLVDHSIAADFIGQRSETIFDLGDGNIAGQPRFVDAVAGRFELLPDSPGKAVGTWGQDLGAAIRPGLWISGEPAGLTDANTATLVVGGPGMFAYRYRLDDGAWSETVPIGLGVEAGTRAERSARLELDDLPPGVHWVEVVGQDFAGGWQTEPTRCNTWVVGTPGDANLDGRFDRDDIVLVLQVGKYGSAEVADWSAGDWNRDGVFNQHDIVVALQFGTDTSD